MIPMRDGVKLHTKILAPRGETRASARSCSSGRPTASRRPARELDGVPRTLADDGYVFVFQDLRRQVRLGGRLRDAAAGARAGGHEGARRGDRHVRHDRVAPRERARTTTAASACSASPTRAGRRSWPPLEPHPALAAISPQASPADMWLGDDFHHNGAFRLSYGFEYAYGLESRQGPQAVRLRSLRHLRVVPRARPALERQRAFLPREDPDLERLRRAPGLRRVLEAPDDDSAHPRGQGPDAERRRLVGPGGLLRPAPRSTTALEKNDPKDVNRLVVGPWNHGGWARGDGDKLGAIPFDGATAKYFRAADPGALVRALPQGPRRAAASRGR